MQVRSQMSRQGRTTQDGQGHCPGTKFLGHARQGAADPAQGPRALRNHAPRHLAQARQRQRRRTAVLGAQHQEVGLPGQFLQLELGQGLARYDGKVPVLQGPSGANSAHAVQVRQLVAVHQERTNEDLDQSEAWRTNNSFKANANEKRDEQGNF